MHTRQRQFTLVMTLLSVLIFTVTRVQAGQVALAWNAPTTNTDGTLLTDLDGYHLYYWQDSWDMPGSVEVGNQMTYTMAALTEGETYSFAVTAYNTTGNESSFSNTFTTTASSPTVPPPNNFPVANADNATTTENTAVTLSVLTNDSDPDGDALSVTAVTSAAHGTVSTNGTTVTYTPTPSFSGTDTFTYTISDGHGGTATASVTVTITPVNAAPVAAADSGTTAASTPITLPVLANDSDPDGDALSVTAVTPAAHGTVSTNSTTVTYTPAPLFVGSDAFTYTVSDGHGGSDTATVTVTVTSGNYAPVATADSATTPENTPVTLSVLANDSDPNGDALTVSAVSPGTHGTVTTDGTTVTYTPASDFVGTDAFTYTVSDGRGGSDSETVTISVFAMIWLEAEAGVLQPPMEVGFDATESTTQYVWVPEDNGDSFDSWQEGGDAHYRFEVPTSDSYVIWGRVHPNSVGVGSFFFAVDAEKSVGSITKLSPTNYKIAPLHVGDTYYVDSPDSITAMPPELDGLTAIKTSSRDAKNKNATFLTLTVAQAATLYVAYEANDSATWLTDSFTKTGKVIRTTNGLMEVWQREVPAGLVTLPGNRYQHTGPAPSMYFALLAFHGEDPYLVWDITSPDAPDGLPQTWRWNQAASDTAPIVFLEAGSHSLTIKQLESGTKLDRILLTNGLEFVPQE